MRTSRQIFRYKKAGDVYKQHHPGTIALDFTLFQVIRRIAVLELFCHVAASVCLPYRAVFPKIQNIHPISIQGHIIPNIITAVGFLQSLSTNQCLFSITRLPDLHNIHQKHPFCAIGYFFEVTPFPGQHIPLETICPYLDTVHFGMAQLTQMHQDVLRTHWNFRIS